jgi:hypothetical protein
MRLDEYLKRGQEEGGGNKGGKGWLSLFKWRKRPHVDRNGKSIKGEFAADIWLHPKSEIVSMWRHGWPKIVESKKNGGSRYVFSDAWPCWETEKILKLQFKRDDDGSRLHPPCICPLCLMQEWVREQVTLGTLGWTDPVFSFEGDNDTQVLLAGGIYNDFGKRDASPDEKAQLKRAKIFAADAWKQSTMAGEKFGFVIVDNDNPQDGPVIAIEAKTLGDKMAKAIGAMICDVEEEGNPFEHPYGFRWIYLPNESLPADKYEARAMRSLQLTDEIQAAFEEDLPDISSEVDLRDPSKLRAIMESVAQVEMPFDDFFGAAEHKWKKLHAQAELPTDGGLVSEGDTSFDPAALEEATTEPPPAPKPAPVAKRTPQPAQAEQGPPKVGQRPRGVLPPSLKASRPKDPQPAFDADDDLPY